MDIFKLYDKFISEKDNLIADALNSAEYFEKRAAGNVRPLVVSKNKSDTDKWEKRINDLAEIAKKLTEADPVRFKPTAKLFKPAPQLIKNVSHIEVRESESTSQSKVPKANIIKRMNALLEAEKHNALTTGDNAKIHQIVEEIKLMEADSDEFYLRRASGYKDIRCFVYLKDQDEPIRVSLAFTGLFVEPANNAKTPFISLPEMSKQLNSRWDKLDFSSVKQIRHSLTMRGKLYSYNDYLALKLKPKTPPAP